LAILVVLPAILTMAVNVVLLATKKIEVFQAAMMEVAEMTKVLLKLLLAGVRASDVKKQRLLCPSCMLVKIIPPKYGTLQDDHSQW
jgi:hypothetical protein